MAKQRDPIGDIDCPLCKRAAELHESDERQRLDADSPAGGRAYPKKFFVRCPPVQGYQGCGTIMANGPGGQLRMMDLGKVFGAAGKPSTSPAARITPAPAAPEFTPPPAKPAPEKNPFKLW